MYKSGYDPIEFINFFERIETLEKKKPGTISRLFSTHPMTGSRIHAAQKEIQQDLKAEPQYVVDTSEFQDVRRRLLHLENLRRQPDEFNRPLLRRRPSASRTETDSSASDSGRPTLKRREPSN
jgi:predicted Zn-dependent protease